MSFKTSYIYDIVNRISPEIKRIKNDIKDSSRDVAKSTKNMSRSFGGFKKSIQRARGSLKKLRRDTKRFANENKGKIKAGIVAGAVAASTSFGIMEKGLVNVLNLLNKDDALKFAKKLELLQKEAVLAGFTMEDTNQGLFNLISSVGVGSNTLETFAKAQILAKGGASDLGSVINGLGKVLNSFGKDTANVDEIVNSFFTAQKFGTTDVGKLAANIGTVSGSAKVLGLDIKDTLSILAILANTLKSTEQASTSFTALMTSLSNPPKESEKLLKQIGITTGATAIKAKGFVNVLEEVMFASKKYPDIIGKAITSEEARKTALNLSSESIQTIRKSIKQISEDTKNGTGLQSAYNDVLDTQADTWARLKGSIKVFGSTLGGVVSTPLKATLDILTQLLNGITATTDAIDSVIKMAKKLPDSIGSFKDERKKQGLGFFEAVGVATKEFINQGNDSFNKNVQFIENAKKEKIQIELINKIEASSNSTIKSEIKSSGNAIVNNVARNPLL